MLNREFIRVRLAPFRSAPYRLHFLGQALSLSGTWMQELAKSWIVINLLGKASAIGLLLLASALPNLIFGSFGGVFADRHGARGILIYTQVILACLALALGVLVHGGHVEFWHLLSFAVAEGLVLAFDIPALNLVTPRLVPREDFQQALALNSVNFHLARVIGPSIAGLLMGFGGPSLVFWMNGVSFLAVVGVVLKLPLKDLELPNKAVMTSREALREVWKYIRGHSLLSSILLQFLLVMGIVFPLIFTALRIHIQETFHLTARDFGLVFAMPGLGALIGSLSFLLLTPKNPIRILPFGVGGTVIFLVALARAEDLAHTVAYLVFFSTSLFLTLSSLLVTVQLVIEHRIRGRISALTGMAFASFAPIMAAPMGTLSDLFTARRLILGAALTYGVLSFVLAIRENWKVRGAAA